MEREQVAGPSSHRSRWRPYLTAAAVVVAVAAALWYVSAPPKGEDGYRDRLGSAAESVRSQVESARIWSEAFLAGDATTPATLVGFEEAERDSEAAASQLESYEPPQGLLGLRSRFSSLTSEASAAIGELRIAAQLEEWDRIAELAEPLPDLSARLDRLEEKARR